MAKRTVIHGELVLPEGIVPDGEVIIDGDHIAEVNLTPTQRATVQWTDGRAMPGLIDLHIHGINGADVMDATAEALATLDQSLVQGGCTRYLATTMAADSYTLGEVLEGTKRFSTQVPDSGMLGIHMEGPFISPQKSGAQKSSAIRKPSLFELERYYRQLGPLLKRVTLAPELPDAEELIAFCQRIGIAVSLGHSEATFAQASQAFDAGVSQVTHLFNAMTGLDHREPGLAAAALAHPDAVVEVIADGVHVHPAIIKMAARLKGPRGVVLVTDSIRAAGLRDGTYDLGGQPVRVIRGVARTDSGRLAGSTLTLMQAVFNYQKFTGVELFEAVRAASLLPARAMGISRLGAIEPGFLADIVLVDGRGRAQMVWRSGALVFDGRAQ